MYTLSIIIFALIASLIVIFFIRFYAHLAFPSEKKPIRLSSSDYDFTVYKDSSFREDVIHGRIVIPESLSVLPYLSSPYCRRRRHSDSMPRVESSDIIYRA
ncbi:MAG: hypothetical protein CVV45_04685 [Spirochaetae bacterium HGW-Spirochaetae-10]|nr:MAG: hypothetical protein CVV45_04685 [Spirochaetae bacterium HGW-Spirochaetae-10]